MKKLTTILCSLAFLLAGIQMANVAESPPDSYNTASAATFKLPLDVQLDLNKRLTDTVCVEIHDTVIVNNTEYVRVSSPENTTDTLYLPMIMPGHMDGISVNNQMKVVREEQTTDEHACSSKEHTVYLTVDGEVVYSSENDNHSATMEE